MQEEEKGHQNITPLPPHLFTAAVRGSVLMEVISYGDSSHLGTARIGDKIYSLSSEQVRELLKIASD